MFGNILGDSGDSLLFFFLLLVIIFCSCDKVGGIGDRC